MSAEDGFDEWNDDPEEEQDNIPEEAEGYRWLRQHPRVARLGEGAYAEVDAHVSGNNLHAAL